MVARPRLVATLAAGSVAALASILTAAPAPADSICPATLLPGQVCTTVDTVVGTLVPTATTTPTTQPSTTDTTSPPTTTAPAPEPAPSSPLPAPLPEIPLLPGPTSPVPTPLSPPSNEGTAPATSTSPGAGAASPASHPAAANTAAATTSATGSSSASPTLATGDLARSFDLAAPSGIPAQGSPFVLGPAPVPSATEATPTRFAAVGIPRDDIGDTGGPSLPRPSMPITLAVLLVAGVLGAHGVRWVDRQTSTSTTTPTAR